MAIPAPIVEHGDTVPAELASAAVPAETGEGSRCIAVADVVRSLNVGPNDATRWVFEVRDGINYLAGLPWSGSELVYCDPPYLMSTRRSGKLYKHEFTAGQHRRLLRVVQDLPCMVMLSGYDSALLQRLSEGLARNPVPGHDTRRNASDRVGLVQLPAAPDPT